MPMYCVLLRHQWIKNKEVLLNSYETKYEQNYFYLLIISIIIPKGIYSNK